MCNTKGHQSSSITLFGVCLSLSACLFLITPSVAEPVSTDKTNLQAPEHLIASMKDGLPSLMITDASPKTTVKWRRCLSYRKVER